MKPIDWPQASIVISIALVAGALQYFGKLPPELHPLLTTVVAVVVGAMKSYLQLATGEVASPPEAGK